MTFLQRLQRVSRLGSLSATGRQKPRDDLNMNEENSTESTCFGQHSNQHYTESLPKSISALTGLKQQVVATAITNLLEKRYFSICQLNTCIELVGARKGGDAYKLLSALHCVDYEKMGKDLRDSIPLLINECLRNRENIIEATVVAMNGVDV